MYSDSLSLVSILYLSTWTMVGCFGGSWATRTASATSFAIVSMSLWLRCLIIAYELLSCARNLEWVEVR